MDSIRFLNLKYFFNQAYELLTGTGDFTAYGDASLWSRLHAIWELAQPYFLTISTYLSFIFLTLFVYSYIRLLQVRAEEDRKFAAHYIPSGDDKEKNADWERIVELTNSDNPNDWKQAIIEADVILDRIVTVQGYRGETLGEKMKSIEPSDFDTLNYAWEAHKVRNRIAHDGGDFVLTQREAKRVVNLFGEVFKEFGYI